MSKKLFVAATGTDIGKTFVAALMVKKLKDAGYNAGYYKAALSGVDTSENETMLCDAYYVNKIAGLNENIKNLVSYVYRKAFSPHLASKSEGNPVEMNKLVQDFNNALLKYDYVTMEGSGGIVCPLRYDHEKIFIEDIIKAFGLPTVIVADSGLGTINHTVLTVEYLKSKSISVKGVILNRYNEHSILHQDNKKMIEEIAKIPIVAEVKDNDKQLNININELLKLYE
ncbi:MAG: dethiobiotin synthase [Clostridia bacterium]|nr:dethiobiotin synthase [Clostridia bacterium]